MCYKFNSKPQRDLEKIVKVFMCSNPVLLSQICLTTKIFKRSTDVLLSRFILKSLRNTIIGEKDRFCFNVSETDADLFLVYYNVYYL